MKSIGKPRYTPSGEFYGYVGSTQDITDVKLLEDELLKARKNLEAKVEQRTRELRDSEEKYRRIVETASEGIWLLDKDNVTSFVNPAIPRMLGYAQQEIIGKTPFDFIDDAYREKVRDHLRNRREGAEEQYICKYRRKDSGEVWAIITANPIYNDGVYTGAFAMITDITERTHAESALKQREADLSLSQKIAHIGSWRWDETTGRDEWSDEFYRILGYEPGEVMPDGDFYMSMVHPDDRGTVICDAMKALAESRPSSLDYRMVRRDGEMRYVHVEIPQCSTIDMGGRSGKFGIIQDITERKRAEEGEERFRVLMNHNPSLVFMKDESGRYVYLNSAYEKQFVISTDWYGKTDFDFWERERARLASANDAEVLKSGQTHQLIEESTDLQGKRYCWLNYKFPFTDSNGNKYVGGIGIDVTDRIRAEEALRESKAQLEAVFSSMNDAIIIFDTDGKATSANHAAVKFHRFRSMDELLTSLNSYVELLDTRNMDGTQLTPDKWPINRALRGEIVFNQDIAITRKDTGE